MVDRLAGVDYRCSNSSVLLDPTQDHCCGPRNWNPRPSRWTDWCHHKDSLVATVPSFNAGASGPNPMTLEQPSPENLLMAAAIMHEQGKFAQNYGALSKEEWSSWTNLPIKEGLVYADKANKDLSSM